jgi:hypothetical protein
MVMPSPVVPAEVDCANRRQGPTVPCLVEDRRGAKAIQCAATLYENPILHVVPKHGRSSDRDHALIIRALAGDLVGGCLVRFARAAIEGALAFFGAAV